MKEQNKTEDALKVVHDKNLVSLRRIEKAVNLINNSIIKDFLTKYAYQKQVFDLKLKEVLSDQGLINKENKNEAPEDFYIGEWDSECVKTKKTLEHCRKNEQDLIPYYDSILEKGNFSETFKKALNSQLDHIASGVEKMQLMENNLQQSELD